MKRTNTLLAALLLGFTLILAGCGSDGGSGDDVASASGTDKDGSKDSDSKAKGDPQADALKFAKCMREHGIEMEDPKGGKISVKMAPGKEPMMDKAQKACKKYLPQVSKVNEKAAMDNILKFAQCMREKGVEKFPDPKGGMMRMDDEIAKDPDFEKAQEACKKHMAGGPAFESGGKK